MRWHSTWLKVIPEYRRDLCIGWATLIADMLVEQGNVSLDIASHFVAAAKVQWTSFPVPRLSDLLARTEIARARLRGVEAQHLDDLDEILTEEFRPYCGAFKLVGDDIYHARLHDCLDRFRIKGNGLRVLYSAAEEYGDGLDESAIEK